MSDGLASSKGDYIPREEVVERLRDIDSELSNKAADIIVELSLAYTIGFDTGYELAKETYQTKDTEEEYAINV